MDPVRFYVKNLLTNSISGDGLLSDDDDLDSESDVPSMPIPVKIQPLVEHIRQRLTLVPKKEFLAVGEQMIPTKGRHELKQYNPAKPDKWGYKNQVLSGASGFSYDFELFAGEQSNTILEGAPDLGVSGNVVARLTQGVSKLRNHKIK